MSNSIDSAAAVDVKLNETWLKNREAFWLMHNDLLATYENQYVAIYDAEVVAAGADKKEVCKAVADRFGHVQAYIEYVTRLKIVRVPSMWKVRKK